MYDSFVCSDSLQRDLMCILENVAGTNKCDKHSIELSCLLQQPQCKVAAGLWCLIRRH